MRNDHGAMTDNRAPKRARTMSQSSSGGDGVNGYGAPDKKEEDDGKSHGIKDGDMDLGRLQQVPSGPIEIPRRRITTACETCRQRKSRCDGQKPKCKLCIETGVRECIYRPASTKLDAGDKLIIERLDEIKSMLEANLAPKPVKQASSHQTFTQPSPESIEFRSPELPKPESKARRASSAGLVDMIRVNGIGTWPKEPSNISTMPEAHTTPAYHLLQWPKIRDLVSSPYDTQSLLQVEIDRPGLEITPVWPVDMTSAGYYAKMFFDRVNKWYACVNPYSYSRYYDVAAARHFQNGSESCVVLLVIALGIAGASPSIAVWPTDSHPPGWNHFACAWSMLPSLMVKNDMTSAQCYILSAAYLFYIVRPLEAWTLLASAGIKLQLLLKTDGLPKHSMELCQRVYWNALLFESDLLAELHLPHSGLVQFEETMQLPRGFEPEGKDKAGEDDLWYFLAEISLRRLLNRVSHLCYTTTTSGPGVPPGFDMICAELDSQLKQWHENLPAPVRFPHRTTPPSDPVQTVLRLRFFACRTIIYRPYILAVLQDETQARAQNVRENCRKCLEACIRQLENVQAHHSGHLPYLWQGALSMMSQTLLIMGATMSPALSSLLPDPDTVDEIIDSVVLEVKRYAHLSPSLSLSYEILKEAEQRRRRLILAQQQQRSGTRPSVSGLLPPR